MIFTIAGIILILDCLLMIIKPSVAIYEKEKKNDPETIKQTRIRAFVFMIVGILIALYANDLFIWLAN